MSPAPKSESTEPESTEPESTEPESTEPGLTKSDSKQADLAPTVGRNELGSITFADSVVEKIAARAAIEIADAGGSAPRLLGRTLPGAGHLGTRTTSLDTLPKTSADVDGSLTTIYLELSVRWPASVAKTTEAVRSRVQQRVSELTGLAVSEVRITVTDLVTRLAPPPRVS
jgi:uncharacterized alkaline shock family protein YloU